MGTEEFVKMVLEKLKEAWVAMENLWGQLLGWMDKVFPPETRSEKIRHWVHLGVPILMGLVLVYLFYRCCKCCCGSRPRRGGGYNKMMKAPGRNCRMPRNVFESNPKAYFRNLRAYPGDELC
ncbi:OLC1v1032570C1 [Oldenlandia corymbosa var. corymbosa]|uniref:OLC1v1032570C1 n=1 Tax=Oldenlandia corymbosa var. corymbosa TaxID=529605 RepID=A0AAV1CMR9_OLDCO|nr:OLC1v1032570C1 [Oldenlandia corymbosa var. corymbosa]